MTEQAQVGDTVRLTMTTEGTAIKGFGGRLYVDGWFLDEPNCTVEILSRATPPLPSEPGTWWLDTDDDVWGVDAHGKLYPVSGDERWLPAGCAPFRQLVLK